LPLILNEPRALVKPNIGHDLDRFACVLYSYSTMKFQDLDHFTNDDITVALQRNDPDELQLVSLTVALTATDPAAAVPVCLSLCSHNDKRVKGNALVSLGHLARRFRSLDEASVKPFIESGLRDPDEYVRMSAKSAADEIHQFLHWHISGHIYGE